MNSTVEGYRALLVPTDLTRPVTDIVIADRGDSGLSDLQRFIGGDIEHVRGPGCDLWVDESGAVCDPPRPSNPRIDALLRRSDGWSIRGDVVITGACGPEGETGSLTADDAARLRRELTR